MRWKKIVMIGPVYPFKGGISHYTGMMCRVLRKNHDVSMVSFRMQYPKFLFKKEQKDFSNDQFKIEDTKFWLNTANPFNIWKTARKVRKESPELVIIQWWHPYFAPCDWLLCRLLGKSKILFVCHNVFPHERFPFDRWLTKRVLRRGDYFLVHSQLDEKNLKEICPNAFVQRVVLPTFQAFRMQGISKESARKALHIGETEHILLFFGFVRPYKGLKYLLQAMPEIVNQVEGTRLFVVGDFGGDKGDYERLVCEKSLDSCVKIVDGYIPDQEVELYFSACDLVVLPYESATQSGIIQIAYGFQKPVVATRVGGLPEVITEGKTGFLAEPKDPASLAESVIRFFESEDTVNWKENIRQEEKKYSWERLEEAVEAFYGE
ncbi:glycosyltransferase [Hominifimenecus sp. rT4P-3]|uniref:glycosyltransferase n=1 Tax=Hominifimenecus sp. rT4P-3 TaxID=3242979 RepID=UPI003DA1F9AD